MVRIQNSQSKVYDVFIKSLIFLKDGMMELKLPKYNPNVNGNEK